MPGDKFHAGHEVVALCLAFKEELRAEEVLFGLFKCWQVVGIRGDNVKWLVEECADSVPECHCSDVTCSVVEVEVDDWYADRRGCWVFWASGVCFFAAGLASLVESRFIHLDDCSRDFGEVSRLELCYVFFSVGWRLRGDDRDNHSWWVDVNGASVAEVHFFVAVVFFDEAVADADCCSFLEVVLFYGV